ncbi:MAG: Crp/Fnr family transcriptional regulator [Flavobacteriales bacterium]|nr:Crp/Fnr family transcriptional regulator [Flavobacteriales bacterium]
MSKVNLLQLFRNYCTPEWQALARSHTTTLSFKAGETIFKEGQKCENMYMVGHGRVKIFTNYAPEIEVILRLATDGHVLGHRGLGDDFVYPVSCVALTPTTVNILPLPIFLDMLKANVMFCFHFMMLMATELKQSEQMRKNLLNMQVKQRVALALKINADAFGFDPADATLLAYTVTRKEMSSLANSTYESVIRSLSDLQTDGVIELERKKVRILDLDRLTTLSANP